MVLRVPTVDSRGLAAIQAPQLPQIDVLGAVGAGLNIRDRLNRNSAQEQLQGIVQQQGQAALGGDAQALNEIALQGPDGAALAGQLQQIVIKRDAQEIAGAQRELKKEGTFLASLVNANPDVQRRKIFDRANELLGEGDRKRGAEFLRISQLRDPLEIKGELQSALVLATGGDKFLQSFVDTGTAQAKLQSDIAQGVRKEEADFRKEERQQAKTSVNALKKRAKEIQADFGKVQGLLKEVRTGKSRAAAAGAIMSVARLISPGVVTDRDAAAIAGAPDPAIAAIQLLADKGNPEAGRELAKAFDPTNPKFFDADGLESIAKSVTAAEAPVLLQQLQEAKSRAEPIISPEAFRANFADVGSIEALSQFVTPPAPAFEFVTVDEAAQLSPEQAARLNELRGKRVVR